MSSSEFDSTVIQPFLNLDNLQNTHIRASLNFHEFKSNIIELIAVSRKYLAFICRLRKYIRMVKILYEKKRDQAASGSFWARYATRASNRKTVRDFQNYSSCPEFRVGIFGKPIRCTGILRVNSETMVEKKYI